MSQRDGQIVFTQKARCRDCYRCLRVCPVKAIRLQDGQATVVPELCLGCGTCIRECPQGAKAYRNDMVRARRLIESGERVAASVAPSFAACFSEWELQRLPSALRQLGFVHVAETAVGAWHVAHHVPEPGADGPGQQEGSGRSPTICSACPAVVSFVEKYRPELAGWLAPVVSPMLAHARMIKARGLADRVVFIGPCVAKKVEAEEAGDGAVDVAIGFTELAGWLEESGVELARLEESGFDDEPGRSARLFPLPGGQAGTAGLSTDLLCDEVLATSGPEELSDTLDTLAGQPRPVVVEALFCPGGCINGPAMPEGCTAAQRRSRLLSWARRHVGRHEVEQAAVPLGRAAQPHPVLRTPVREEEIQRVLAESGKAQPEDQLDCGACCYATCRDKAVAVLRGMAEAEMCLPLMRRLAEQRTDRIIETSPNGIVIMDEKLRILHANPAFRRFFVCSDAVLGRHISYLMDPASFEHVLQQPGEISETTVQHESYQLVCRQIAYLLPAERQVVGIFVNLTDARQSQRQLVQLREQTLQQAEELLQHQLTMAQTMAKFLGESTARREELVHHLLQLAEGTQTVGGPGRPAATIEGSAGGSAGGGSRAAAPSSWEKPPWVTSTSTSPSRRARR